MTEYVAGFLFTDDELEVLLIEKNRPEWQRGKHNAIGGRIEPGETPLEAQRREFKEEVGLEIYDWKLFVTLVGDGFKVYFFYAHASLNVFGMAQCRTDEMVKRFLICEALEQPIVPNVSWLIPMALSMRHESARSFVVNEVAV